MRRFILGVVVMVWLVPVASADNGVLEINQACAVNTGCFTGDSAGFPVEIDGSVGRSYRLTSDLVLPTASVSGIVISAPSVSIDLNGFEIVTAECVGATSSCTPGTGHGDGIGFTAPGDGDNRGISVRNGSVTGMGDDGVKLGKQAEVINVRARWNGSRGIYAQQGSTVTGSSAYQNGGFGFYVEAGSTILGNTAHANGGDGFRAQDGSTVSGNTAYLNSGKGIVANHGSTVSGNTVRANEGYGLDLGPQVGYAGNVISGNTGGTVFGPGVEIGTNLCNGTTTCP